MFLAKQNTLQCSLSWFNLKQTQCKKDRLKVNFRVVPQLAVVTPSLQVAFNTIIVTIVNLAHRHITLNLYFLPHASKDLVFSKNAKYNPITRVHR